MVLSPLSKTGFEIVRYKATEQRLHHVHALHLENDLISMLQQQPMEIPDSFSALEGFYQVIQESRSGSLIVKQMIFYTVI